MSDHVVDELTEGDVRVRVIMDEDPMDPRDADMLGVMVCEHRSYNLGDHGDEAERAREMLNRCMERGKPQVFVRWAKWALGSTVVLPLYLMDHSGLSMSASSTMFRMCDSAGWDWGMVGVIFDTAHTREYTGAPIESIERQLFAEVDEYDSYLRGDCYGVVSERRSVCDQGHVHWEQIDACWGFIGDEYASEEAKQFLADAVA